MASHGGLIYEFLFPNNVREFVRTHVIHTHLAFDILQFGATLIVRVMLGLWDPLPHGGDYVPQEA